MTLPKVFTAAIGSAAALAMLPAMASSSSIDGVKTIDVSIAGYDLSDPAHAQIVYYKIQKAAKRVCKSSMIRETLAERAEEIECRDKAISAAVAQINSPALTLVMNERARFS